MLLNNFKLIRKNNLNNNNNNIDQINDLLKRINKIDHFITRDEQN